MACTQQHADLPGGHETGQQAELDHRLFYRLPTSAASKPDSRHPYHAPVILYSLNTLSAGMGCESGQCLNETCKINTAKSDFLTAGFFSEVALSLPGPHWRALVCCSALRR